MHVMIHFWMYYYSVPFVFLLFLCWEIITIIIIIILNPDQAAKASLKKENWDKLHIVPYYKRCWISMLGYLYAETCMLGDYLIFNAS